MISQEVVVMFQIGAMAVYPAHGVGVIESIQDREVAGFQQSFYIMRLLDTDMIIMIPTRNAQNIGLRTVIDTQAVAEIFGILRERPTRLNQQTWNRRYRDYMDKIKTGSLFRVAEVLRDLTLLKLEKELSFGERKMLDTAKNLLVKELSLVNNKKEDEIEAQLEELLALEEQVQIS
jgi:CarD family transcriptional regulator